MRHLVAHGITFVRLRVGVSPPCALPPVQKTLGPEQNSLRLQQNQELDQLLKEGSTFTVVDQPVSLDRLQLRNIDQLNASSETWPLMLLQENEFLMCG